jgi:hypothetical protein
MGVLLLLRVALKQPLNALFRGYDGRGRGTVFLDHGGRQGRLWAHDISVLLPFLAGKKSTINI